ncbi:TOBE domain protein [hydrothermal vent metagenome]|uniref:TOBE domain protein n=1 Tax=hydrothermal vent metagenome TaxID=652676 RepID=A0A1W1C961_9ZZZZ
MSTLRATLTNIQSVENLNIVTFASEGSTLKMMSLELHKKLKKGTEVLLSCKPTAVAIAKDITGGLSYSNQLHATIVSMEMGQLICSLELDFHGSMIESIITSDSAKRLNLQLNDNVTALIKSTDLAIGKIL